MRGAGTGMDGVSDSWIWLLVAALFGGGVGYVLSASRRRDEAKPQRPVEAAPVHETLDIVSAWPAQVTRVLGTAQRLAHRSMVTALPEYTVLAQVPLARFLQVPRRHSYAEWLRRAGHLGADFVICDSASQVVCVVLLSADGDSSRRRQRIELITRVLKGANVRLVVWRETALPSRADMRNAVLPQARIDVTSGTPVAPPALQQPEPADDDRADADASNPRPALAAGRVALPVPDVHEDHGPDTILEPPPSTWFDDVDSRPLPLHTPPRPQR